MGIIGRLIRVFCQVVGGTVQIVEECGGRVSTLTGSMLMTVSVRRSLEAVAAWSARVPEGTVT